MNIYPSRDELDIDAAIVELKRSGSITSESARKAAIAAINTAALLDIAASLRVVAAEALAAMPRAHELGEDSGDEPDAPRDFLVEGDLVAVSGLDDPAEVVGFGFSEGAAYATIRLVDGSETRAWLDTLTRLVGDERDDDAMRDAGEAVDLPGVDLIPEPIIPEDLVDDIDDDFEGDEPTTETKSALDLLKANEAERKAAKKSGAKKGKKS